MPFQPINYSNILAQNEQIRGQQTQNALAARQFDPNSLENQLRSLQVQNAQQQQERSNFQYGDPVPIGDTGVYGQRGPQGELVNQTRPMQVATPPKAPDKQRLFEFAVGQGYTGSFEEFLKMTQGKGVQINNLPSLKEGQQYDFNPDGTLKGIVTVPGSDRQLEQQAAADQGRVTTELNTQARMEFLGEIDKARGNNTFWTTGMLGKLATYWSGSDAAYQERLLERIQGEVALDRLSQAQAASKTGGVFGSLQKAELDLLKNSIQALEVGMSQEQMQIGLDGIKEHRLKWDGYNELWNDPEAKSRGFVKFGNLVDGNKIEMLNESNQVIGYYE